MSHYKIKNIRMPDIRLDALYPKIFVQPFI